MPKSEKVKNPDKIRLYASNENDVFDSFYIEADGYVAVDENIYTYSEEGKITFYALEADGFFPVETKAFRQEISVHNIKGVLDVYYCEVNNQLYFYSNNEKFRINDNTDGLFTLSGNTADNLWLWLHINPQKDNFTYPVKFDIRTGEIEDVLEFVEINADSLFNSQYVSKWQQIDKDTMIAVAGKRKDLYSFSMSNNVVKNLTETMSLPQNIDESKILDSYLFVVDENILEPFNYVQYNLLTGEKKTIYENYSYWNESDEDIENKVFFTGGRYDIVKLDDIYYVADEYTGERFEIEGMTDELAWSAVANKTEQQLMVSAFGTNEITGQTFVKQLGIIDITNKEFYLVDRENAVKETSIGWQSENQIVIQAHGEGHSGTNLYVYSYKKHR